MTVNDLHPFPSVQLRALRDSLADGSVRRVCAAAGLLPDTVLLRLAKASEQSEQTDGLLPQIVRTASAPEVALMDAIARDAQLPRFSRERLRELVGTRARRRTEFAGLPSERWCQEHRIVIGLDELGPEACFVLAAAQPLGAQVFESLVQALRSAARPLQVGLALPSDVLALSEHAAGARTQVSAKSDLAHLRELAEEGPVIELVNQVLSRAVTLRASDIHSEPKDLGFAVRARVDGQMLLLDDYTQQSYEAFVCRVKILAGLDIAERRLPQDGRIDARINGEQFDVRVSVIPTVNGESMVLRLLRQERSIRSLADLGFSASDAQRFESWARLPNGIVLVTGPTGSGKSTTLYTALELSKRSAEKIITVEDPVEYRIEDITQIQVHEEIGLTFAAALRSVLRHDPDVVLVGEIRDVETAKIAVQAALTGHLVLSTLHTNSAEGAITRLMDMGVDAYLLADSLRAVLAQRLVRKLCEHCALPDPARQVAVEARPPQDLWPTMQQLAREREPIRLMRPVGCTHCYQTGYRGRTAVFDLLEVSAEVRSKIRPGASATEITKLRQSAETSPQPGTKGNPPWSHAWREALTGKTSLDEVMLIVQMTN